MPESLITLTNVQKIYRTDRMETIALQGVNLSIERGEFLSIMGVDDQVDLSSIVPRVYLLTRMLMDFGRNPSLR